MSEQRSRTNDSHPFQYEKGVFVSYAQGGDGEEIVNQIEQALQRHGVKIIRDKRDLRFKGSIRQFMERIGRGYCVIVVISDKYLRSSDCMFELVEIAEAKQFRDRVFPIVLGDANIYDPVKRIEYVRYWETKRAELAEAMKTVDPANLQGIRDDIDLYDRIRDEISGLTSTLRDMNTLTPELHREGDYRILVDAILRKLSWRPPKVVVRSLGAIGAILILSALMKLGSPLIGITNNMIAPPISTSTAPNTLNPAPSSTVISPPTPVCPPGIHPPSIHLNFVPRSVKINLTAELIISVNDPENNAYKILAITAEKGEFPNGNEEPYRYVAPDSPDKDIITVWVGNHECQTKEEITITITQ